MKKIGDDVWVLARVVNVDDKGDGMRYRLSLNDGGGDLSDPWWVDDMLVDEGRDAEAHDAEDDPQNVLQRIVDDLRRLGVVR